MSVVLDGVLSSAPPNTVAALSGESVATLFYALSKIENPDSWLDLRENPLDEITPDDREIIDRIVGVAAYELMTVYSPIPIGFCGFWPDNNIPNQWLVCNGQAVSRETYSTLFAQWGTQFGAGDGSTTFNLIDMRDRSPMGVGSGAVGDAEGSLTHTLTIDEIPSHDHAPLSPGTSFLSGGGTGRTTAAGTTASLQAKTGSTGGGQSHSILHPIRRGHYIVFVGVDT